MNKRPGVILEILEIDLESLFLEELRCDARFSVCTDVGEYLGHGSCPDCGIKKRMILCLPCKNKLSGSTKCGDFRAPGAEFFSEFTAI